MTVGPARRWFLAVLAALLLVGGAAMPVARAQTIDDLRAEAEELDRELAAMQDRLIELAEEYNRATADRETASLEVAAAERELVATQAELDVRASQLRDYAVRAYVDGGTIRDLEGMLGSDVSELGRRITYLSSAVGDRRTLIEELRASRAATEQRARQVAAAKAEVDVQVGRLEAARREASELQADLQERADRTKGQLADLVREAEARRLAEEQRAAQEAARQQGLLVQQSAPRATVPAVPAAAAPTPAAPATPPRAVPAARPEAGAAVAAAMSMLGVPYVWGGSSPDGGFDCSGLTMWAWAQAGRQIPRPADYQRDEAIPLTYEQLQPGDLVFYGEPVSHVGMYIGNDEIINAPQTGELVSIKTMWYSRKPMTYGRIP